MESNDKIVSEPFSENCIIVYSKHKEKMDLELQKFEGTWYDKLNGWLVPKKYQDKIHLLINIQKTQNIFDEVSNTFVKRNKQKKYHRAISDDEDSSPEDFRRSPRIRKKRPQRLHVPESVLLASESSESEESSDDSDFPDPKSPRNHEKEYDEFLRKQKLLRKKRK